MYMSSTDTGMHFKNVYELYRYWDAFQKCIWALQILGCISKMYMSSTDTEMHFKNVYELYRYWDAFQKCIWALQILGCISKMYMSSTDTGMHFKNVYELLNLRALKISMLHKTKFCVEFGRVTNFIVSFEIPHSEYLPHTCVSDWNYSQVEIIAH